MSPVGSSDNVRRGAMPAHTTLNLQRPVEVRLEASNWPDDHGIRRQTTFDSARLYRRTKQTHIKSILRPRSGPIWDEEKGPGEPQDAPQEIENNDVEAFDIIQARWVWRDDEKEFVVLTLKNDSSTISKNDPTTHMQWQ